MNDLGNISVNVVVVFVTVDPDVPPIPYLQPPDDILRTVGEAFTLSCFVKVMIGVRPALKWSYFTNEKPVSCT